MNTPISADALRRAASIRDQIDQLEVAYKAILTGESAPVRRGRPPGRPPGKPGRPPGRPPGKPGRKPGRPAAVAVVAPAAAAPAAVAAPAPASKKGKKKRKLSPEARARIVAAVKARWARERGEA